MMYYKNKNSEVIRSMVVDEKCCTLTSRYCDFYLLISKIVDADNVKAFSLPDLFISIDALVHHR